MALVKRTHGTLRGTHLRPAGSPGFSFLFSLVLAAGSALADEPAAPPATRELLPPAFEQAAPASVADLRSIQRHLQALAAQVSPAVVAVQVGGASGSGVVVSDDGLVLTAAHVCGSPGREVRFLFPDGSTARGRTLGTHHGVDGGLMRITDPGPWPFLEKAAAHDAHLGDWVLGLGHPGGFDATRSLVVRLGRIIELDADTLQTDCILSSGDSGGPLIDMRGRVVGIHSRISEAASENYHVAIKIYHDDWTRFLNGEDWGGTRPNRGWAGIRGFDHPDGCGVGSILPNSPAANAGLMAGDIIQRVDERVIDGYAAFRDYVADVNPGETIHVHVRRDGTAMTLALRVEARPRRS